MNNITRTVFATLLGIALFIGWNCEATKEPHETLPFLIDYKDYTVQLEGGNILPSRVLFYDLNHDYKIELAAWYSLTYLSTYPFRYDYLDSTGNIIRTLWDYDTDGKIDNDYLVPPAPKDSALVPSGTRLGFIQPSL